MGSYRLEIIAEMLQRVTAGHFGREHREAVHVRHQARGRVPAHPTPASQEQWAAGSAQDTVHTGHKVTHFPEQQEIQLPVITAVQCYALQQAEDTHAHTRRTHTHRELGQFFSQNSPKNTNKKTHANFFLETQSQSRRWRRFKALFRKSALCDVRGQWYLWPLRQHHWSSQFSKLPFWHGTANKGLNMMFTKDPKSICVLY